MAAVMTVQTALDHVDKQFQAGQTTRALDDVFEYLSRRREAEPASWPEFARGCLDHPLRDLFHEDPFTFRAFSKPRGYAGDAVMMDYIYGLGEAEQAASGATPQGRRIFEYMGDRASARGVRYRRRLIASLIDRVAQRKDARVLAIAAGHLREVELSAAVQAGRLSEFVAFDQDETSLGLVDREYAPLGVRPAPGSVRQILSGKAKLGEYDLVYAAGLFDYLSAPVAAALTRRMFEMTRPGGVMLIPNFLTGVADSGYMEAFMDWHLIYRNHADMRELAAALPPDQVADCRIFNDDSGAIVFLQVTKASRTC
jgi:hypothetical protein